MADFIRLFQDMLTVKEIKKARDKLEWEEVKDLKTLSKIKTVEDMLPIPAENQTEKEDPYIWEQQYKIIEDCLKQDCTIEEACMYAWISVPSYYVHRKKNPDFAIRMDRARQFPKMMARAAVMRKIHLWDANVALKYLTLRDKRYNEDSIDEIWWDDKVKVEFTLVPSKEREWAENQQSDSQTSTNANYASEWYADSSENEKMTPRENEEEALRRLDSLSFNNE